MNQCIRERIADLTRDFFVRHSDDDAREARYLHRTWRKSDGGFYVGIDPPEGAKAEGIVRILETILRQLAKYNSTILALEPWGAVLCTTDVSRPCCLELAVSD